MTQDAGKELGRGSKWVRWWQVIGPGLLMAGAAIGVSHVVQSTRAGASFGLALVGLVILVNVLKYPFFEFGHRYASATGENLLQGYRRLGRAYLIGFLLLNIFTAIISLAGVTLVTAVLTPQILGGGFAPHVTSAGLLIVCFGLIAVGQYRWLDGTIKVMMALLFIATLIACIAAVWSGHSGPLEARMAGPSPWTLAALPFLIALMGWMPAPIELSVWQSLWFKANEETRHRKTTGWEAKVDFNVGYMLCLLLAVIFVVLGSMVMHGIGDTFAESNAGFARQFIQLYTVKLGAWSAPVIIAAAFITMFSTTLTVLDAYPRSLAEGWRVAFPKHAPPPRLLHVVMMLICGGAGWLIIQQFTGRQQVFHTLIDAVTITAFLTAPVFAFLNYRLITSRHTPADHQPGLMFRLWSWAGMLFLLGFSIAYIVFRWLSAE